jgi:hypothetical protein
VAEQQAHAVAGNGRQPRQRDQPGSEALPRSAATPPVGARRLQLRSELQNAVADALEAELGHDGHLRAQLAASALIAALGIAEETAAARMAEGGRPLDAAEVDALLDDAVTFAEAGMAAIAP